MDDVLIDDFAHIEDEYIRAYNRIMIANNFTREQPNLAREYLQQFDDQDKMDIHRMIVMIKNKGWDFVRGFIASRRSE